MSKELTLKNNGIELPIGDIGKLIIEMAEQSKSRAVKKSELRIGNVVFRYRKIPLRICQNLQLR